MGGVTRPPPWACSPASSAWGPQGGQGALRVEAGRPLCLAPGPQAHLGRRLRENGVTLTWHLIDDLSGIQPADNTVPRGCCSQRLGTGAVFLHNIFIYSLTKVPWPLGAVACINLQVMDPEAKAARLIMSISAVAGGYIVFHPPKVYVPAESCMFLL